MAVATAALVAARMALPRGEQVAHVVHPVRGRHLVPPRRPRRRRGEGGDELALPRLALRLGPRPLGLDAAPLAVVVIMVGGARGRRHHERGRRGAGHAPHAPAPPRGVESSERAARAREQEQQAAGGGGVRPARHARVPHLEAVVPRVRAAVVGVEVADEAPALPGLHAELVVLAGRARRQRERQRRLVGGRAQHRALGVRRAARGGGDAVAILGAGDDRLPRELDLRRRAPRKARRLEPGLGRAAQQHALERAGVVARPREVDEPRQVHDEPLRPRGRDLEPELRLVVARIAARVGRVLVDADVHAVPAGGQARERVRARRLALLHAAADPAAEGGAEAAEVGRRRRRERLTVEAQLERDLRRGAARQEQHGQRDRRREPARPRRHAQLARRGRLTVASPSAIVSSR
jgi:hypothetical protein